MQLRAIYPKLLQFQFLTTYCLTTITLTLLDDWKAVTLANFGWIIFAIVVIAIINAFGYYLWDIVKSVYKKIKKMEEKSNEVFPQLSV